MKKALVLVALVAGLVTTGVLATANTDNAEVSAASAPDSADRPSATKAADGCNLSALDNDEYVRDLEARAVGGNPPCPTLQTCYAGNYECNSGTQCGADIQVIDTGWTGCDLYSCLDGETIHVERGVCEVCPCCKQTPGCVCEQDPTCTGYAVKAWYCQ